ncbi:MAG: ABC-2 family transporter protein [Patescibacteria group bacterium]
MSKYLAYFKSSFHTASAYKVDFFLGMATELVFFFIFFTLWKTVYDTTGVNQISGYTLKDTITYYFVSSIIFKLDVSSSVYLGWQIWSGYLSNDLIRPWSVTIVSILDSIAENALSILIFSPLIIVMIIMAGGFVQVPGLVTLIYFIISLIIGFLINLSFQLIFNALTFKFGDQEAVISLVTQISQIVAGGVFPLVFLPGKLSEIFQLLPFKHIFFTPATVFLGKLSGPELYIQWTQGICWAAIFFGIYYFIYRQGLKLYSGTGR